MQMKTKASTGSIYFDGDFFCYASFNISQV